ncbi:hypothetical protein [Actinomadura geliboluensis]|uniref:hypothetical protein n=1 Tax=Actinomadura geliboluensis TaxID=882440 RepID=UPI00368BD128
MNLLTLNQYLVADKLHSEQAADAYDSRRKQVEAALLAAREQTGLVSAEVTLPGLGVVASVTLKKGTTQVDADEDALLATVEKHQPNEVEETIDPEVLEDPEVIAWLREHRPAAITRRVRPAWRNALLGKAKANGGYITTDTGDKVKIADVTRHDPTGAFQLTLADTDRAELAEAIAALGSTQGDGTEDTGTSGADGDAPQPETATTAARKGKTARAGQS